MKHMFITTLFLVLLLGFHIQAQDTFSIVAIDSITGEVGSAGASCVDMSNFPNYDDDFLGELFPGVGAINTQAYYHATNQANARNRMNLGDTPSEIIQWLVEHDVQNQPQIRQYGIVAFVGESPESAAHTGTSTNDYKNHITRPSYAIQGNILLGQVVLDSMESRFLHAEGDLACKLMAALQGAKMVGADTRCTSNGTSSLFSFVKVAQPTDVFGEPSFVLSVRTSSGAGIEPIDSLQSKFDEVHSCTGVGVQDENFMAANFRVYPNPVSDVFVVESENGGYYQMDLLDMAGHPLLNRSFTKKLEVNVSSIVKGIYLLRIYNEKTTYSTKIVIE